MKTRGCIALAGVAVGVASLLGAPVASAAGMATTTGTAGSKTTLVIRPTAPVSTAPVALSSKVKPNPASTTAPAPTGNVCFYEGAATTPLICKALAASPNGVQTVHVKVTLAPGSHAITARYAGDATYAPSASKSVIFTVS